MWIISTGNVILDFIVGIVMVGISAVTAGGLGLLIGNFIAKKEN